MEKENTNFEDLQAMVDQGAIVIGADVDTQFDFAKEGGALYVDTPAEVLQNLALLTQKFPYRLGSVDSHAYDAWEFTENGGPFPAHCLKGEAGWLKINETRLDEKGAVLPKRFIPMAQGDLVVGENKVGTGNRNYDADSFFDEVMGGKGVFFEKEVYSAFSNPLAEPYIERLVQRLGGTRKAIFAVFGHCTGGYCVDAMAEGLADRGYQTLMVNDAVAPINFAPEDGAEQNGAERTRLMCEAKNITELTTQQVLRLIR